MFNPEFLTSDNESIRANALIQYLQEQSPDVLERVARSASPEIQDIIRHNVQGLLGSGALGDCDGEDPGPLHL